MQPKVMELSIVVPVFNEYNNLLDLTANTINSLAGVIKPFEIILIDDGSTDGSSELLDQLEENYPQVRVIHFTSNNGQTAAMAAGFAEASGKLIATMDADLQVDPAEILKFLPYIKDYDLVTGIRKNRQDSLIKKVASKVGNTVRNWLTGEDIKDTGCPLKLFKRRVIENLDLYEGMHYFLPTLALMEGYKVTEVPINHLPRKHGKSKYGINDRMWIGLLDTLAVRWMKMRKISYQIKEKEN